MADSRHESTLAVFTLLNGKYLKGEIPKPDFFFTLELEGTYKHIMHTIHNLCIYYLDNFSLLFCEEWGVFYRSLFSRYKASSTLQLSVHRLKPVGNASCNGYLRTVATTSDVLYMMRDVEFLRFQEKGSN